MRELDLRISASDWRRIRDLCSRSFRGDRDTELGVIGLLGRRSVRGTVTELLVSGVLWPEEGDVINHRRHELRFSSRYLRRAHMAMRTCGLAGVVTFHTHPLSDRSVQFSLYDDAQDPLLLENLQELHPATWLASVVLGAESQRGRLWTSPREPLTLNTLVSVGDHIEYLPLGGETTTDPPSPSEIFDRAKALTGAGAMAKLSGGTALVAGASGTGSLTCELLARAGCRRVMVADPDVVKPANLNRILYATRDDAERRTPKPEVLKRGIEGLGLGCEVVPINGSVLDNCVMQRLNEADFLFGCVDADFPRTLLCKYSYQYLVPYIDMGTEIGGDDEGIVSTDSRVSYMAPGRWCLRCSGFISPRRLAFESLTAHERKRKIAQGYSDDLLLKQPAVMDLNMRAASAAVLVLRHLLQPFLLEPLPVALKENFVTANVKRIMTPRAPSDTCDICRANPNAGFGDCGPPVGLPSEMASALLGTDRDDDEER
jgi:hypothetical protein